MSHNLASAPRQIHFPEEIDELRQSHTQLALQVALLRNEINSSRAIFHSERLAIFKHFQAADERAVARTVHFSRRRAKKVLLSTDAELGKNCFTLCASNSVVQVVLRSTPSECTLHEFQLWAMKLLKDLSVHCYAFPSEYHVKFPNINRCSRLDIVFDTYADLCQALEIDCATRESALYREKKNRRRNSISVRVLGVEKVISTNRRIFLARNPPSRASADRITTLYQASTSWFEDSWECGFSLRSDLASTIHSPSQMPDCVLSPEHSNLFSLSWERMDIGVDQGSSSEIIGGAVRSSFPAVVLRTRLLTSSTRAAFMLPVDGVSLRQRLATPQS